jgi:hypothetical protein
MLLMRGGPSSTFVKHLSAAQLTKDLLAIYLRLTELGTETWNGQVRLANLDRSRGPLK